MVGNSSLPSGRFVAGTTDTPLGAVRFIGVCIPWRDAHVRTGRRDRLPWEDHLTYLQHLGSLLAQRDNVLPTIVLGDFNQRIPCARQPLHVHQALVEAFTGDFAIVTAGALPGTTDRSIDHLACTETLQPQTVEHLSRFGGSGAPMSDHFGLRVLLHLGAGVRRDVAGSHVTC
jgi:endonuclease/exonuclease/phosphatase family metal-dependent hydrolase